MVEFKINSSIDRSLWDACVARADPPCLYGESWFLDCISENWAGLIMNDYEAVMPLPWRKKWNIHYIYPPVLCQRLGIFYSTEVSPADFIEAIPVNYRYIHIRASGDWSPLFEDNCTLRSNYILPLEGTLESLQSNYANNTKRAIKKANGVQFIESADIDHFIQDYRKVMGDIIEDYSVREYKCMEELLRTGLSKGKAIIKVAYAEGEWLAAIALFADEHRLYNIFNFTTDKGKQRGAMHFLVDQIIDAYKGKGLSFDFEGSMIPGVARFYQSFGAMEERYSDFTINRLPFWLKWLK